MYTFTPCINYMVNKLQPFATALRCANRRFHKVHSKEHSTTFCNYLIIYTYTSTCIYNLMGKYMKTNKLATFFNHLMTYNYTSTPIYNLMGRYMKKNKLTTFFNHLIMSSRSRLNSRIARLM